MVVDLIDSLGVGAFKDFMTGQEIPPLHQLILELCESREIIEEIKMVVKESEITSPNDLLTKLSKQMVASREHLQLSAIQNKNLKARCFDEMLSQGIDLLEANNTRLVMLDRIAIEEAQNTTESMYQKKERKK